MKLNAARMLLITEAREMISVIVGFDLEAC